MLDSIDFPSLAPVVTDFGFLGATIIVILIIVWRGPFELRVDFDGQFCIGSRRNDCDRIVSSENEQDI